MPEAKVDAVELVVRGVRLRLRRADVLRAVRDGDFGMVRQHAVEIERTLYPVKEVFARATGIDVLDFNTTQARAALRRLGFEVRSVSPLGRRHP
ncbi:MAG TPA: hypothetical protein VGL20_19985 [Candidatus Dormibacteraeota bacterium]|jgi:hypothetical protein